MSMFLPEGQQQQPVGGVASVTPSNPETTQEDIALMQRVLSAASRNPNLIPSDFMAYLIDYVQTSRLEIPVGQVFGFQRFLSTQVSVEGTATVSASESTTVATYGNLATVGPSLSALKSGKYIIVVTADIDVAVAGVSGLMSIDVNSGGASDSNAIQSRNNNFSTCTGVTLLTLTAASNSVVAKYRTDTAGTAASFINRKLIAIRYDVA